MPRLGVNIDHIATLREARKTFYPDPVESLDILAQLNVDQVTCHLREDRRHIQDADLKAIIESQIIPVNMEMAATDEMVKIACALQPQTCTLVPEKREEITTEGGLDCLFQTKSLHEKIITLQKSGIRVSLFIDPEIQQIETALSLGVKDIELHTGTYCEKFGTKEESHEWHRLQKAAREASSRKINVFAGHGLNRENLPSVLKIKEIEEYNIGHSIIARAVFVGLKEAIHEIQHILKTPHSSISV